MDEELKQAAEAIVKDFGPLPDRVSTDRRSPYYDKRWKEMGVNFNGLRCPDNVLEYCVSEGWIVIKIGFKGEGQKQVKGVVQPYWVSKPLDTTPKPVDGPRTSDLAAIDTAAAKRARKAEKAARMALMYKGKNHADR